MSKKIGILVSDNSDITSQEIFLWITSFGHTPILFNEKSTFTDNNFFLSLANKSLTITLNSIDGSSYKLEDIDAFYQRKWGGKSLFTNTEYEDTYKQHINDELTSIRDFILSWLKKENKILGYCSKQSYNKLFQIYAAKICGFRVPKTIVTNNLKNINNIDFNIISKSIQNPLLIKEKDGIYSRYTSDYRINSDGPNKLDYPLLFQKKIQKKSELRIFYFLKEVFVMRIDSSKLSVQTDIRLIMSDKKTRLSSTKIDSILKKRIIKLMTYLDLSIGSIDIIQDNNGNSVFLEVNPFGQYGMVSKPCNYYLEKKIAKKLISGI